jgi:uncharacterized membrane protein
MYFREYAHHHVAALLLFSFCAWLSLSLIIRFWLKHQTDPWHKKIVWSLVLCIPFFGWILYGAFYTPLSENNVKASLNTDAFYGGH